MRNPSANPSHPGHILFTVPLVFLLAAAGCTKTGTDPGISPTINPVITSTSGNLLANSNFGIWDPADKALQDWNIQASQKTVIARTPVGIKFSGNAAGAYYIYQLL